MHFHILRKCNTIFDLNIACDCFNDVVVCVYVESNKIDQNGVYQVIELIAM